MKLSTGLLIAAAASSLGAVSASAQPAQGTMKGMDHGAMAGMKSGHDMMPMDDYMPAMKKMNMAMMSAKGSTPDATFARKMIAHHQGAIDMAQIQLKQGKDAEAKRLAQKTIDENRKGIAELQAWLKSHGG